MRLLFMIVPLCLWGFCGQAVAADGTLNGDRDWSLNAGAFVWHAYAPRKDYVQFLENRPVVIERRVRHPWFDAVLVGDGVNSKGNRCFSLGVQKTWNVMDRRWSFEGVYAYVGEFLAERYAQCGDEGFYDDVKRRTGLGFTVYIYHGVEYDLNPHLSLEAGVALPAIVIFSLQWHF